MEAPKEKKSGKRIFKIFTSLFRRIFQFQAAKEFWKTAKEHKRYSKFPPLPSEIIYKYKHRDAYRKRGTLCVHKIIGSHIHNNRCFLISRHPKYIFIKSRGIRLQMSLIAEWIESYSKWFALQTSINLIIIKRQLMRMTITMKIRGGREGDLYDRERCKLMEKCNFFSLAYI